MIVNILLILMMYITGWGYSTKQHCKTLLEKHFIVNEDYINHLPEESLLTQLSKQTILYQNIGKGGHNKEFIFLNVKTFKKLCMKANTQKADSIHEYYLKIERINSIYFKNTIEELKQKSTTKQIKDVSYSANESSIYIPSAELTDFNKSGIYFMILGKNILYNLDSVPNDALIIKVGHAKESGFERTKCLRKLTGEDARVLDYIATPHYEQFEKQIIRILQAENRIVTAKLINKNDELQSGTRREHFYVTSVEDFNNKIEYFAKI